MTTEIFFDVEGGTLAALDHGGTGRPVLLVHGSGHNAAAWGPVADALRADHRVVAVDLRGHGHSTAASTAADQYWRDLAAVTGALGWEAPLLVGHSTGGYAVTAVTAAGLVRPAGICNVDGLVLDDRATAARALAGFRTPEAAGELLRTFGYGTRFGDDAARTAWIDAQVDRTPDDPMNAGADPELVRAVLERAVVPDGAGLLRRPVPSEIAATTTAPVGAPVYPSVDVYDRIDCPMTVVLPDRGFYAHRRAEVAAIVDAAPGRSLVDISAGHNAVMTHPKEVVAVIREIG